MVHLMEEDSEVSSPFKSSTFSLGGGPTSAEKDGMKFALAVIVLASFPLIGAPALYAALSESKAHLEAPRLVVALVALVWIVVPLLAVLLLDGKRACPVRCVVSIGENAAAALRQLCAPFCRSRADRELAALLPSIGEFFIVTFD